MFASKLTYFSGRSFRDWFFTAHFSKRPGGRVAPTAILLGDTDFQPDRDQLRRAPP